MKAADRKQALRGGNAVERARHDAARRLHAERCEALGAMRLGLAAALLREINILGYDVKDAGRGLHFFRFVEDWEPTAEADEAAQRILAKPVPQRAGKVVSVNAASEGGEA